MRCISVNFIAVSEAEKFTLMQRIKEALTFNDAQVSLLDGVRADFDHGWGLIRASNTTPSLVLRFEADNDTALLQIQQLFRTALHKLLPGVTLPF
jgi:phosphomannomutase/phosphoglucomutase